MNRLCAGGTIARRTDIARSIGGIEVAKGKPERTYRGQNNKKQQAKPNSPDHIEPPLAGSIASGSISENRVNGAVRRTIS